MTRARVPRHIPECRYSGETFQEATRHVDDCCCPEPQRIEPVGGVPPNTTVHAGYPGGHSLALDADRASMDIVAFTTGDWGHIRLTSEEFNSIMLWGGRDEMITFLEDLADKLRTAEARYE